MSAANINQAMADALGVQLKGTSTFGVTLRMRAGRLPTLTVHRHIFDASQVSPITERFELRPLDEPRPLDLDAMATEARKRVARAIDASADMHLSQMGIRLREVMNISINVDPVLLKEAIAVATKEVDKAYRARPGAPYAC